MPEEKDKLHKQDGEPSLEEQLQALLSGLPAKSSDVKQPPEKLLSSGTPQIEQFKLASSIGETPEVSGPIVDHPVLPVRLSGPISKEPIPAHTGEPNKNPLTEELAALFGTTPPTPGANRPANIPPAPTPPATQATGAVTSKPPVSEPTTYITQNTIEAAFKSEVIEGPKTRRPFLGLSFLQKRIISISLEGTSLRILTIAGNSIETWASIPVEPRFLREGYVADIAGMGESIAKALQSQNIGRGKVICSFTSLGSTSRILSLPQSAKRDLANIVPRELRRASINVDNYLLNWRVLPIKQGPMQVFIVGIPREPLTAMVEALRMAKCKPAVVELKPLTLARAINQQNAIIAHGERDSLELVLVVGGIPILLRSIYLGIDATPHQVVTRLAEELERTIFSYNGPHREQPLDAQIPIYITGEIANYQNLINSQVSALGRNIAPLEPPIKLPDGFPTGTFMVNIGLLLKMT